MENGQLLRMRFWINRWRRSVSLVGLLGKLTIVLLIIGAYVFGRTVLTKEQFSNPEIVIDNTQIDCGCEEGGDMEGVVAKEEAEGVSDSSDWKEGETLLDQEPKENSDLALEDSTTNEDDPAFLNEPEALFMASRSGEKYYPLGCKLGDRVKEENRVFYRTAEEAEVDGKTIAEGCLDK